MDTRALRVEAIILCRSLEIVNNEFYLLGGGWGKIGYFSFPGFASFQVAIRLIVPFIETDQELMFDVTLETEDGLNILPGPMQPRVAVGRPVELMRGEEQAIQIPLGFVNIEIPSAGTYVVRFQYNDRELARTSFVAIPISQGIRVE